MQHNVMFERTDYTKSPPQNEVVAVIVLFPPVSEENLEAFEHEMWDTLFRLPCAKVRENYSSWRVVESDALRFHPDDEWKKETAAELAKTITDGMKARGELRQDITPQNVITVVGCGAILVFVAACVGIFTTVGLTVCKFWKWC